MKRKLFILLPCAVMASPAFESCSSDEDERPKGSEEQILASIDLVRSDDTMLTLSYDCETQTGNYTLSTHIQINTAKTYILNGKSYMEVRGGNGAIKDCDPLPYVAEAPMAGIRIEGSRVMVNKEEYLGMIAGEYQQTRNAWAFLGDESYLPYEQTEDGELVLYDYAMEVGDQYPSVEGYADIKVIKTDTVTTADSVRRRHLLLSNGLDLVEGLGCINSLGIFYCYLNPSSFLQTFKQGFLYYFCAPEDF